MNMKGAPSLYKEQNVTLHVLIMSMDVSLFVSLCVFVCSVQQAKLLVLLRPAPEKNCNTLTINVKHL